MERSHDGGMNPITARYYDWMSLKSNLLWIYEGRVPDGKGGTIFPEYFSAFLILKGRAVISHEGASQEAAAGDWIIPWPGFRQQFFSPDAEILSIRFQAHWPDGRPLFEQGLSVTFPAEQFPELEIVGRELLAVAKPSTPEDPTLLATHDLSLEAFLELKISLLKFIRQFVATLRELGLKPTRLGTHDERILNALFRLDLLPLTEKLREHELAKEVGLGLSQFVRLFRSETGVTPKKYLELRKRDTCKRMLLNSAVPLKQIAIELGFTHPSDFSYWFKRNYTMSPKAFRQNFTLGSNV